MLKRITAIVLLVFVGLCAVVYLYGISLRKAELIMGKASLQMAYKHYLEHGYPTNFGNHYQIFMASNVVSVGGTNFRCFLTLRDGRFGDQGVLSMTTNEIFVWQDARGGAKVIPPGYRPPLFPPSF
jgi:hypothetical protein